jgi:hypothetical protein
MGLLCLLFPAKSACLLCLLLTAATAWLLASLVCLLHLLKLMLYLLSSQAHTRSCCSNMQHLANLLLPCSSLVACSQP